MGREKEKAKKKTSSIIPSQNISSLRQHDIICSNIFLSPSADNFRAKAGSTMWPVRLQGHYSKPCDRGIERTSRGRLAAVVLPVFAGKGLCAKKHFADLIFWFFSSRNSDWPSPLQERVYACYAACIMRLPRCRSSMTLFNKTPAYRRSFSSILYQ